MQIALYTLADSFKWLIVPILLLGVHHWPRLSQRWRIGLFSLGMLILLSSSAKLLWTMHSQLVALPEWDFSCFWIYGRVAVQRLNFSDHSYAQQIAQTLNASPELLGQLDFPYLPPSIFLFSWLGWFDMRTAYLLWYIVHSAILILDVWLLWKIFLGGSRLVNLMLVAVLILSLPGTHSTVWYGQTNFLVLLSLLMFWRNRDRWRGGPWLVLGILTKPFLGLMLLYSLSRQHWRVIGGTAIALTGAALLTLAVFGPAPFWGYFSHGLGTNRPDYVYIESVNQSLLATILRLTDYDFSHASPLTQPIFVGLAIGITGMTGWLSYRLDHRDADWGLAMILMMALLIYPGTLVHYSVQLIVPILLLWKYRNEFILGPHFAMVLITSQYILSNYHNGTFLSFLVTWLIIVGIVLWRLTQAVDESASRAMSN